MHEKYKEQSTKVQQNPKQSQPQERPWQTGVYQRIDADDQLIMEMPEEHPTTSPIQLRRSTRMKMKNPKYANVAVVEEEKEPTFFEEASQKAEWRKAIEEEIKALAENQTWDLVPKPKNMKPISCKWVYKIKTRPDGSIERYKAQLIAKGYSQTYRINYIETFALVAKINIVIILLSLAANLDWPLHQFDIKNTFLNGDL